MAIQLRGKTAHHRRSVWVGATLIPALIVPSLIVPCALAQPSADSEIRVALTQWMDDFNARRADKVCDLFAPDLIADYRGLPERGYDRQCDILKGSLADRSRSFSYALTIKEIQVWGDIAMARVTWTLTIRQTDNRKETKVVEPGLDIFRRQSDGRWQIIRYIAYDQE